MRELRGNLEQHVLDRMVAGMAQARALEEILDDFGAPKLVSRGMWGVHMKPRWTKAIVGVGLVTALSLPMLVAASSVAVLPRTSLDTYSWIGLDSVFRTLNWTDANLSLEGRNLKITKSSSKLYLTTYTKLEFADSSIKNKLGERYVQADTLIQMLSNYRDSAVTFDQSINTKFRINNQTLDFSNLGFEVDFRNAISVEVSRYLFDYVKQFLSNKEIANFSTIEPGSGYQHYVKGNAEPNHPYLAIWTGLEQWDRKDVNSKKATIRFGVLQSDVNGDFKFETAYREVHFTPNWASLNRMKNNEILLVKMTGCINPDWKKSLQEGRGLIDPSSVLKIPVSIGHKTL